MIQGKIDIFPDFTKKKYLTYCQIVKFKADKTLLVSADVKLSPEVQQQNLLQQNYFIFSMKPLGAESFRSWKGCLNIWR